jgi:hypothetical protein
MCPHGLGSAVMSTILYVPRYPLACQSNPRWAVMMEVTPLDSLLTFLAASGQIVIFPAGLGLWLGVYTYLPRYLRDL